MSPSARIELVARRALDNRQQALADCQWYGNAFAWCESLATVYKLPTESVVGVVSALSPLNSWESQLEWSPRILAAFNVYGNSNACDLAFSDAAIVEAAGSWLPGPGLGANKKKAALILCGKAPFDILGGQKVRAFFANIMGDEQQVCVDRHAWAIATGDVTGKISITAKRYRDTVEAFREASKSLVLAFPELADVLTPAGVQALTWVWWRDNKGARF